MRGLICRAICACLIGFPLSAQDPGTIEVGFYGSQRNIGEPTQRSAGALVTVFLSRRVAIETHQDVLSNLGSATGSMWMVMAQPFGNWRLHAGPGAEFSVPEGQRPHVEPSLLAGARVTLWDWVGLRADARIHRAGEAPPGATAAGPLAWSLFGGFSIRVRG